MVNTTRQCCMNSLTKMDCHLHDRLARGPLDQKSLDSRRLILLLQRHSCAELDLLSVSSRALQSNRKCQAVQAVCAVIAAQSRLPCNIEAELPRSDVRNQAASVRQMPAGRTLGCHAQGNYRHSGDHQQGTLGKPDSLRVSCTLILTIRTVTN